MKKFLSVIFLTFIMLNLTICFAMIEGQDNYGTLEANQLILGYISVDDKPSKIIEMYGHPDRVDNSNGVKWYYGRDFYVQFIGRGAESVEEVTTTGDNGISTADNVGVGMSENVLNRIYGNPSYKRQEGLETKYWYYGYGKNNWTYLQFITKNGKIIKISLVVID